METVDATTLATVVTAFLVAGVVKGALGMGLPMISMTIMGTALGLWEAIPTLMIPSFLANLWQFSRPNPIWPLVKRFGAMNLAACLGIWISTAFLFCIDAFVVNTIFGVVVIVYAGVNLTRVEWTIPREKEKQWGVPVGFFAGLLTGVSGLLLLPLVIYLQTLKLDKDTFVQAAGLSMFIATVIWAAALYGEGAMTIRAWTLSAIAVPPVVFGLAVGIWLRGKIREDVFRSVVYIFLILLSANVVRKGFM